MGVGLIPSQGPWILQVAQWGRKELHVKLFKDSESYSTRENWKFCHEEGMIWDKLDKMLKTWKCGYWISISFEHIAKSSLLEMNSRGMVRHNIKARLGLHQFAIVRNLDSILCAVSYSLKYWTKKVMWLQLVFRNINLTMVHAHMNGKEETGISNKHAAGTMTRLSPWWHQARCLPSYSWHFGGFICIIYVIYIYIYIYIYKI